MLQDLLTHKQQDGSPSERDKMQNLDNDMKIMAGLVGVFANVKFDPEDPNTEFVLEDLKMAMSVQLDRLEKHFQAFSTERRGVPQRERAL